MPSARIPAIFKTPGSQATYTALLVALRKVGPFEIELKKTCVHVVRGRAFVGVHPRARGLRITLVMGTPLRAARVVKMEQASARRFYCDVQIDGEKDIDTQLVGWLRQAHALTSA